jgi:hypothetical protein
MISTIASGAGLGEPSDLLKLIETSSEELRDLILDFTHLVEKTPIPLLCFYEQIASDITSNQPAISKKVHSTN